MIFIGGRSKFVAFLEEQGKDDFSTVLNVTKYVTNLVEYLIFIGGRSKFVAFLEEQRKDDFSIVLNVTKHVTKDLTFEGRKVSFL